MNEDTLYTQWRDDYREILEGLSKKDLFLLYSGGKDSSLTLDFILRAAKEFGFGFQVHAGAYPVHRYTEDEKKRLNTYWQGRGVEIAWHFIEKDDDCLKDSENPCTLCQELRKKVLKKILTDGSYTLKGLVLIPSYSLWDIVSYSLEHILADIFSDSRDGTAATISERFFETAQRFYPLLEMKEGYTIVRPLIKFNNTDILKLIEQKGIPLLSTPCEFKDFRPKRIFEKYYNLMGLRFQYDRVFDFSKKALNLPDRSSYTSLKTEKYLREVF